MSCPVCIKNYKFNFKVNASGCNSNSAVALNQVIYKYFDIPPSQFVVEIPDDPSSFVNPLPESDPPTIQVNLKGTPPTLIAKPLPPIPPPLLPPSGCNNFAPATGNIKDVGPVYIVNQSTIVDPHELILQVSSIQNQINKYFAPAWGVIADLQIVTAPPFSFFGKDLVVYIKDGQSDVLGAAGYHNVDKEGFVFTNNDPGKTCIESNCWQSTLDHEILEMLVNPTPHTYPDGNWSQEVTLDGLTGRYIIEVCDPVNSPKYNNGILNNFVYPNWYIPNSPCPWDFLNLTKAPLVPLGVANCETIFQTTNGEMWVMLGFGNEALKIKKLDKKK